MKHLLRMCFTVVFELKLLHIQFLGSPFSMVTVALRVKTLERERRDRNGSRHCFPRFPSTLISFSLFLNLLMRASYAHISTQPHFLLLKKVLSLFSVSFFLLHSPQVLSHSPLFFTTFGLINLSF